MFEARGVVSEGDKRGEHVEEDGRFNFVHLFPDPVGNAVRSRGRGRGAFAQGLFYLFRGQGASIPVRGEPFSGRGLGLGREEVLKESVVYGRGGVSSRERWETRGLSGGHVLLGGPDVLGGRLGQEVCPVRGLGLLNRLEVA